MAAAALLFSTLLSSTLPSTTTTFARGFQGSTSRTAILPAISAIGQPRRKEDLRIRRSSRNAIELHLKRRAPTIFVANVDPSNGESVEDKTSSNTSSTDGPPPLTILAGVLVFLLLCWILGSIVMWLINLIVNVPSS